MLFPAIQSWLVGADLPLSRLYFGSLPEKNAADEAIAVAVTESSGGEPEKHIGREDFPSPTFGIEHDGGILYYRTLLEFTARAAERKDVLLASLTLNRVRDRMMMIANNAITLPADAQLDDFDDWPDLYGIDVEQERIFGVDLESAAEYDEQDPAGRETLRLGILVKHYPIRTGFDPTLGGGFSVGFGTGFRV